MELKPKRPIVKGPSDWFTGDVWVDTLVQSGDHSTLNVAAVHFTPGARTAWHPHEGGQTLYVTEGEARVRSRGEPAVTIRVGDVVHTPSGEWHCPRTIPLGVIRHGRGARIDPRRFVEARVVRHGARRNGG
ncbi:MAG TPA: cupin domain-containing protein [Egibacteraceae bacterium]|jgi:quercetin dioxygenase-like cupin family protein|nr:cupin domain-containing protein [Egibacteraceae bacterium]